MGCGFSSGRSYKGPQAFNGARVVHVNGHVEEFVGGGSGGGGGDTPVAPVKVSDVTGMPPKMILCSSAQLCTVGFKPLGLGEHLENNRLYFLLPKSVFDTGVSPMDHVVLAKKLYAVANDRDTKIKTHVVANVKMNECFYSVSSRRGFKPDLETIVEVPELNSNFSLL